MLASDHIVPTIPCSSVAVFSTSRAPATRETIWTTLSRGPPRIRSGIITVTLWLEWVWASSSVHAFLTFRDLGRVPSRQTLRRNSTFQSTHQLSFQRGRNRSLDRLMLVSMDVGRASDPLAGQIRSLALVHAGTRPLVRGFSDFNKGAKDLHYRTS